MNELESLRQWKREALESLKRWDEVAEYVRTHGGRLGHLVQDETLRLLKDYNDVVSPKKPG